MVGDIYLKHQVLYHNTKYDIDEELKLIAIHKVPLNLKFYPRAGVAMSMIKCKPDDDVDVREVKIPGYMDEPVMAYLIEPRECGNDVPCIVFYHGGGFLLKPSIAHYHIAKEYAKALNCKVVIPDYRLIPEHPFPIPPEECYCTYKWVLDNANELGINTDKIVVAGDSAGGNLSIAVTLMLRDRDNISPSGVLLVYPTTDRSMSTESMKKYVDTPIWDARLSEMMWKAYLGDTVPENVQYASPIEADSLKGFPTTYMEIAEFDCLRDEGIIFAERLKNEGIPFHMILLGNGPLETLLKKMIEEYQHYIRWLILLMRMDLVFVRMKVTRRII